MHIIPSDDLSERKEMRLATAYVSDLVYQKLTRDAVDDVRDFLQSTKGDYTCYAIRGQLFESFVMSIQSENQSRTFRVKPPEGFPQGKPFEEQA